MPWFFRQTSHIMTCKLHTGCSVFANGTMITVAAKACHDLIALLTAGMLAFFASSIVNRHLLMSGLCTSCPVWLACPKSLIIIVGRSVEIAIFSKASSAFSMPLVTFFGSNHSSAASFAFTSVLVLSAKATSISHLRLLLIFPISLAAIIALCRTHPAMVSIFTKENSSTLHPSIIAVVS